MGQKFQRTSKLSMTFTLKHFYHLSSFLHTSDLSVFKRSNKLSLVKIKGTPLMIFFPWNRLGALLVEIYNFSITENDLQPF